MALVTLQNSQLSHIIQLLNFYSLQKNKTKKRCIMLIRQLLQRITLS